MLIPQVHQTEFSRTLLTLTSSSFYSHGKTAFISSIPPTTMSTSTAIKKTKGGFLRVNPYSNQIKSVIVKEQLVLLKAVVSVKVVVGGIFSNLGISRGLDDITDLLGRTLVLELVSSEASKYIYMRIIYGF
ncbi:Lipoxygenase [Thalictrum thalictroides]|uniref:Lipoxygenase n=1 Tax=Thalictrum thalictroides TaxID=46969 RepID=A0A7J6XHN6_THATH|nr:Lipoxygenase [Thalictrum thalictroides]